MPLKLEYNYSAAVSRDAEQRENFEGGTPAVFLARHLATVFRDAINFRHSY